MKMATDTLGKRIQIDVFFDKPTSTFTYLLADVESRQAIIIDSVMEYDPKSGRTRLDSAQALMTEMQQRQLNVQWLLETHVHADHLSAAHWLKVQTGARIGIGDHITAVQSVFSKLFNVQNEVKADGRPFDHLFADGEKLTVGALQLEVMYTPGHTPACVTYVLKDEDSGETAAFVGDTIFMPDYGTARCDFPGGDARVLYKSINRLLSLPAETRLYMCHDYQPGGRDAAYATTVQVQRDHNVHVKNGITEESFVSMRTARDKTLDMPVLILPSVQVNMRAGELPPPEDNGVRYIKIPLNAV